MTRPIAPAGPVPHSNFKGQIEYGVNALSAPTTPSNRILEVDKSKIDPNIVKAAQGLEGMFLDYMMKVMRQTVPKNEMDLESPATQIYRGMLDSEVAEKTARSGGIGLADQIIAHLVPQRYTQEDRAQQEVKPLSRTRTKEIDGAEDESQ